MTRALLAALGALLAVLTAAPAHAVADDATPRPVVAYPLARPAETSGPIPLAICGRFGHAHGIRPFAREADEAIPGLRIYTARHACQKHPRAIRVHLRARHYGEDAGWYAETVFLPTGARRVEVNRDLPNDHPHAVVVHEFGHVLGLAHHADPHGVDGGVPNLTHLSRGEIRALRHAYPVAH